MAFRYKGAATPIPVERDFGYALDLLTCVRRWLNEKDVANLVAEERVRREARP